MVQKTQKNSNSRKRPRVQLICSDPSRTHQSFKDDCDINTIMRKIQNNSFDPSIIRQNGRHGDFSGLMSYQESLQVVIDAEEQFAALPAAVRDRFHNDPQKLLAFVHDEKNKNEAIALGLIEKTPEAPPAASKKAPGEPAGTPAGEPGAHKP